MRYPIAGIGTQGKSPNVTAQGRINLYMDIQPQEDKTLLSLHERPGLSLFSDFGDTPARGAIVAKELMYWVHRGTLWSVNNAGTKTNRGTFATYPTATGRVDMAYNQGGQIHITDGIGGYTYTIATTTLTAITDAQYYDAAAYTTYHDGYFIVPRPDSAEFYLSDTDDGTSWDPLIFATAEKSPDNLTRVWDNSTEILLLGTESIEMWNNTGAADFPYERVSGGVVELGLHAPWSVAKFGESSTVFLAVNAKQGQVKVIRIDGFQYTTISNPDIESIFNTYSSSSATAYSYNHEGHPFYQINFPTDAKSWIYDGITNLWSEVSSGTVGARHRGEIAVSFLGKVYVSDYEDGRIYIHDKDAHADAGIPFAVEFQGRHIFDEKPIQISRLWVDMETGVGDAAGSDPQLSLWISRDGGHSWGNEKTTSIGKIGEYAKRAIFRRLGRGFDMVFRLRSTAPVKRTFVGAWINPV
jgi:hypothetical protein